MDSSISKKVEKRGPNQSAENAAADYIPDSKKRKQPPLAGVIVEALKVDSLQRICWSLEPLLRRIVSEEVERALAKFGHGKLARSSPPPRIQGPEGRNLQLQFRTEMPPHLFTGGKVEGDQGAAIHVVLMDVSRGSVVQTGQGASARLSVVVLQGDFNEAAGEDWTQEYFESQQVKERKGKRPLLTGDLQVTLKEGVGTIGDLSFTDNSSWIRSRKFRLGLKVAPGNCERIRIREAKTNAFAVKDHRGELYKKHYPPALNDEVWRLDRIAKDGALHKKLLKAEIVTVKDFLRLLVRDPQKLRNILGSGMSNRMWENTVEHAKTCVLGGKLYVYYADQSHGPGVVFNHIYELRGLIADGHFLPLESLNHNQKMSVDSLVKIAYENWEQVVEYDGKVLNSLVSTKKGRRSLVASTPDLDNVAAHNLIPQNIKPLSNSGSMLRCENQSNHSSVHPTVEFSHIRSGHPTGMVLNNPQVALTGTADYFPLGTAGCWGSNFPRNEQGLEDMIAEEIRLKSSEMLRGEDMKKLLKTFSGGISSGMGATYSHPEPCYAYSTPYDTCPEPCYAYGRLYETQVDRAFGHQRGSSGKAVVGWLKLKAALRWGIFVRKRAAERRAHVVDLE